jgi:putative colanic acid biosynthesis acetyltransferase WcaF
MNVLLSRRKVDLSRYDNTNYSPGRGFLIRTIWHYVNALFLQTPLNPSSGLKKRLLRLFGARIGSGVVLKPSINIKYPWNLTIGDHVWIGEHVWLDSLAQITLGDNVCISQGAYLCSGSHDNSDSLFRPLIEPITIEDGAWIGAKAIILPGVTVRSHSVIAAGSVIMRDTEPYMVYSGNPAIIVSERIIK